MLGLVLISGCKKLDEVNTNPNNPLSATPATQFLSSELLIGYSMGGDQSRFTSMWMQQITGVNRQAQSYNVYVVGNADFDPAWGNFYQGMTNLNDLIIHAQAAGNNYYVGVSKILMAYTLGMSTDVWNNMPYSKAFQGVANLQPAFDNQQALYATMHQLCDDGIAALGKSPGKLTPGTDDLIYGGNTANWIALAHGLKARFYLHTSKVNSGDLAKCVTEANLANTAWGGDAYIPFGSTNNTAGPVFQFQQQRAGDIQVSSSYLANILISTSDPRLGAFMDTTQNIIGPFYGSMNSGVQIMTQAEVEFILAEAAFRNGDLAGAATNSNAATISSVTNITGSAPTGAWLTSYASETAGTITLAKIIGQKYIALYLNPEVFSDWRRTGLPAITEAAGASTNGIPRRFFYAETETERNANTPRGLQLTDRVWWDVP